MLHYRAYQKEEKKKIVHTSGIPARIDNVHITGHNCLCIQVNTVWAQLIVLLMFCQNQIKLVWRMHNVCKRATLDLFSRVTWHLEATFNWIHEYKEYLYIHESWLTLTDYYKSFNYTVVTGWCIWEGEVITNAQYVAIYSNIQTFFLLKFLLMIITPRFCSYIFTSSGICKSLKLCPSNNKGLNDFFSFLILCW